MNARWCLRTTRAALFAAVCVLLAALGHVLMSGEGLPWWVLASAIALAGAVGWAFGAHERRRRTVAALTVAVQTCLHVAFTLAQSGDRPSGPAPRGPYPAGHSLPYGMDGMASMGHVMPPTTGTGGGHDMTHMAHSSSWGMLAAHLLAAVLCGLWLALGESAAFALVRACADRAFVPLRLVLAVLCPPPAPPSFRPAPRQGRRPRRLLLVRSLPTRGPPGETAVL
ncbi:hypothetical protein [Streptomyces sp. NPDC048187]|uniref:hypothetical protein n=1 Tax=Streptomyces sp. NPDC048187 TaxID=3365509 RepID=UPI003718C2C2